MSNNTSVILSSIDYQSKNDSGVVIVATYIVYIYIYIYITEASLSYFESYHAICELGNLKLQYYMEVIDRNK